MGVRRWLAEDSEGPVTRPRPWGNRVAMVLGVVGALVFLLLGIIQTVQDAYLMRADRTAEATVLERSGRHAGRVEFFTPDGRRVEGRVGVLHEGRPGDKLTVRYHPADPEFFVRDPRVIFVPFLLPLVMFGAALGMVWITRVVR